MKTAAVMPRGFSNNNVAALRCVLTPERVSVDDCVEFTGSAEGMDGKVFQDFDRLDSFGSLEFSEGSTCTKHSWLPWWSSRMPIEISSLPLISRNNEPANNEAMNIEEAKDVNDDVAKPSAATANNVVGLLTNSGVASGSEMVEDDVEETPLARFKMEPICNELLGLM